MAQHYYHCKVCNRGRAIEADSVPFWSPPCDCSGTPPITNPTEYCGQDRAGEIEIYDRIDKIEARRNMSAEDLKREEMAKLADIFGELLANQERLNRNPRKLGV